VDPLTHSLTGAALSRAGLHRTTPLATSTLVIAANAPDVDAAVSFAGTYASLAFRRGITHGPIALLVLPFVVTGAILLYDRFRRRRKRADAPPVRILPTLGLATLGVLTHPALDWMNTYGIRLLMPFSERWFYGDSLFIIDPWIWLALAAPLVAVYATTRRRQILWAVLALVATALMLLAPPVPLAARVIWMAALLAIGASAWKSNRRGAEPIPGTKGTRVALGCVVAYILLMVVADVAARGRATAEAERAGLVVEDVMVAPAPVNPFAGDVVVETLDAYELGRFEWFRRPHVVWQAHPIPKGERTPPVLATLQLQPVRDFLRWSRYPFVDVQESADGYLVRFGDARYPDGLRGGLGGITVEVQRDLQTGVPD
jgi:inner membrane protein